MTDYRSAVVAAARSQLGKSDPYPYMRDVLPKAWSDAEVRGYTKKAWCGIFSLWCLRQASLAPDIDWIDGRGYLFRLRRVLDPLPGDIGYQDVPWQHHFVIESADAHTFTSIDGNQGVPGVQERHRSRGNAYNFYSIASLIPDDEDTQPGAPAYPTLRMNSMLTGDVQLLQKMLGGLKIDGQFGPKTAAAVMEFQRSHGLEADGVVGPLTWKTLLAAGEIR